MARIAFLPSMSTRSEGTPSRPEMLEIRLLYLMRGALREALRGHSEGTQRALRGHSERHSEGAQRALREAVACAQVEEDEVRQRVEVADLGDCVVLVVEQPEALLALQ